MNHHVQSIKDQLPNLDKMNFDLWELENIFVRTSNSTNAETPPQGKEGLLLKYVDTEKPGNSAQTFSYVVILFDNDDESAEPVFYDFEQDALQIGQSENNCSNVTLTKHGKKEKKMKGN